MQWFRCTTYPRRDGLGGIASSATLPEVAEFPLQNNAASAAAALKIMVKDTKPKGFSP
jgi:hypothetical protein